MRGWGGSQKVRLKPFGDSPIASPLWHLFNTFYHLIHFQVGIDPPEAVILAGPLMAAFCLKWTRRQHSCPTLSVSFIAFLRCAINRTYCTYVYNSITVCDLKER